MVKENIIKNRYEFMLLLEAAMCNPNGDPDMGNTPRQDPDTGIGYMTDTAIKSRIRSYVQDMGKYLEILMRQGQNINRTVAEAVMAANNADNLKDVKKGSKIEDAQNWICDKYWDARTFGAVMSTGRNAGQIRGAVQIAMPSSVDPISVEDITITRKCYTEGDFNTLQEFDALDAKMDEDKKRTMGNKKVTPYGLYIVKGAISACLAEKSGFTEDDLKVLFEALLQMYNHDISSSKIGMNVVSPLIVFKHVGTQHDNNSDEKEREAKLGCAPAQMLYNLLSVKKKDDVEYPRQFSDYDVTFNKSGLPDGVEVGFKYLPFTDIEWNTDHLDGCGIKVS